MTDAELDDAVEKALADGDNVKALCLLVEAAGGKMTLYGQPIGEAGLKQFAQSTLEQRFRWDGFVQATKFGVKLKAIEPELRGFVAAARKIRGGDGNRDTTRWWRSIPRRQKGVRNVAVSGEIADAF